MRLYSWTHGSYVVQSPRGHVYVFDGSRIRSGIHSLVPGVRRVAKAHQIAAVFVSHFHWDHNEGFPALIDSVGARVDAAYSNGGYSTGGNHPRDVPAQDAFDAAVAEHNIPYSYLISGDTITDPDLDIRCYGPAEGDIDYDVARDDAYGGDTLFVRFAYGDFSVFLTGDRQYNRILDSWNDAANDGAPRDSTVFVARHHGDFTTFGAEDAVTPVEPELIMLEGYGDGSDDYDAVSALPWSPEVHVVFDAPDSVPDYRTGPVMIEGHADGTWTRSTIPGAFDLARTSMA